MKHRVALIAVVLASPALLAAQSWQPSPADSASDNSITATDGKTMKTVTVPVVTHPACPVAMQAKQGSGVGLVAVRRQAGEPDNGRSILDNKPGQQIHLILGKVPSSQLDFEQVSRATVTARGLSARSRIDRTPADLGSSPSDLRRTLDVAFGRESDGTLYADLELPGFTSVQSIRIDSIVLKDGSKWSFDAGQHCTVTPDPLMLIAAH
jgi:hypothetical protein